MTELRTRMIDDLRIRKYSENTITCYVRQVSRFARHFGTPPDRLGAEQIREYQLHLVDKGVSVSTQIQVTCALRFLYTQTLRRDEIIKFIPFARKPKKLPIVLSQDEVRALLEAPTNWKHRAMLASMYAAGLRVSELTHLRVEDIDSKRMQINIRHGKGAKDRLVMLSPSLLELLRKYWRAYRPSSWLFPGKDAERPMTRKSVSCALRRARRIAGITKPCSPHTLRHCFATHLMEAGYDVRRIQVLLGHRSLRTTTVYLHLAADAIRNVPSPLDLLAADHRESLKNAES